MRLTLLIKRPALLGLLLVLAAGCGEDENPADPYVPSGPRTWRVPQDVPTIQAGIDLASPGDTVLVASGTYQDCTRVDPTGVLCCVVMKSGVYLRGEAGEANGVVVDAQSQGRVMYCGGVDSTTTIEGFMLRGGNVLARKDPPPASSVGGGVYCYDSSPRWIHCAFNENIATSGGGMYCEESSPTLSHCSFFSNFVSSSHEGGGLNCISSSLVLTDCSFSQNDAFLGGAMHIGMSSSSVLDRCTFWDNRAQYGCGIFCIESSMVLSSSTFAGNGGADAGGAIFLGTSSPEIRSCTLVANSATDGGGIYCDTGTPVVENTLIAFNHGGGAVYCEDEASVPNLICCDLYDNVGGDWADYIADQGLLGHNRSDDPLFCDSENRDFHLSDGSPCAPGGGCSLIGAWDVGCGK
jgi:predicted outer membrane repeat protein